MDCPKCGLTNPENALSCDCGYDFYSGTIPWKSEKALDRQRRSGLGIGALRAVSTTAHFLWVCSIACYALSLLLPSVSYGGIHGTLGGGPGLYCFIFGPVGLMLMQKGAIGWLANPLFLFSAGTLPRKAGRSFFVALILALVLAVIAVPMMRAYPLPADESGALEPPTAVPSFGYYFWLGSMLLMLIVGTIVARRKLGTMGLDSKQS
jgi:hypothetical protein